ncbi:MAG: SDR family NAD(P)-dependent oxidoreductase, partial [Pseudomonadota bacterium]
MKTILVTGASQGIGAATARAFWAAGWHVGLLARRAEPMEKLAQGQAATVLPADVTDPEAVQQAVDKLVGESGRLDVLFNNAGMFGPSGSIDTVDL